MRRTLPSAAIGRLFTFLCLLTFSGALSTQSVFVDPAGADVGNCSMPGSPCLTIGYAVSQAMAGGTVEVAAGTYNENVNIDKSLTLQGTGNPTVQGSDVSLGTFQVLPNVNDVTIDGFTLIGFDAANAGSETAALYLQGAHSNITITNNTITANGDAGFTEEFGALNDNLVIDGNTFDGQTFPGAQAGGCGFGNQFSDPTVPRQLVVIGNSDTNVQFTNNIISGTAGSTTTAAGCETTGQGNTLVTIDAPGAVITGNTFSGTTARFASMLRTRGDANTITGNTFDGTNLISTTTFHFLTDNTLMGGTPATAEDLVAANSYDPNEAIFDGGGSFSIVACPVEDTTVFAGDMSCEVVVEFDDASATVTYDPPSGTAFQLGDTEVTRMEDFGGGNTLECLFTVTVLDTVSPTLNCPLTDTIFLPVSGDTLFSRADFVAEIGVSATDNCPMDLGNILIPNGNVNRAFSCDDAGMVRTVSFVVRDESDNESVCMVDITTLDTIAPILECSDITVALDSNGMAMIENDTALDTLFDNCDMDPSGPFTVGGPTARTFDCTFADSTVIRTVVATDMSGNQGSCDYEVTIIDTIAPVLECSDITVALDSNGMAMIENDTALDTLFDNCDMDPSGPFT
ncbi:hypothetical protein CEQ90_16965, partial [Lewinellaceae bacterium SD302]